MSSSSITHTAAKPAHASGLTLQQRQDAWRSARDETSNAFRHWCSASIAERRAAYAVYLAASDREIAAELALLNTVRAA